MSTNIVSVLNDLVETSKDGEKGFRKAAEDTKDTTLKQLFTGRAEDCARGAHELQDVSQIHFLFVGEGAEKEKLVQRALQLELTNTTFLDPVGKNEVREFYALADVCLVPLKDIPLFETFIPSKMFEMMSMARPIVGSLRGEAADILRRSGGALVVEPENSHELTQAILRLYRQEEEGRREMGQRGRDFVTAHYSRQALAASYLDVMKEAVIEYRSR